jgi:hypothetical protein
MLVPEAIKAGSLQPQSVIDLTTSFVRDQKSAQDNRVGLTDSDYM